MSSLKARLKGIKQAYKAAKERDPTSGFERPPDGIYRLRLIDAELGESQTSGRLQVKFEWTIEGGDQDGRSVYDYQGVESEDNIFYFGRLLSRLGYDMPDDPEEIPDLLEGMVERGLLIQGQLKSAKNPSGGDDFQNLRVKKLLEGADVTPDEGEEELVDDDAAADDAALAVGDAVRFTVKGNVLTGEVVDFHDANTAKVKADNKVYRIAVEKLTFVNPDPDPDDEEVIEEETEIEVVEEETDEDEIEVDVGTTVTFEQGGKPLTGVITEFVGDDSAKVRVGKKLYTVSLDTVEVPLADEAGEPEPEEEEAPPQTPSRKPKPGKGAQPAKTRR